MRLRDPYRLPGPREAEFERARRLEWMTILFLVTIVIAIYATMGSSQAMKTAWVEDMLSLIPPIGWLIAARIRTRAPDASHPYGYHRAIDVAAVSGSLALAVMGSYMLYEAIANLVSVERPTIGARALFGETVWSGWLMIGALVYSAIPPFVLGRLKLRMAERLHDKALHADAEMNRADWLTALAGILGVLGLGLGFWWADAVAAGAIALDITRDGFTNLRRVTAQLMDHRPTAVASRDPLGVGEDVRRALLGLPWVEDARVRLREEGYLVTGEAYLRSDRAVSWQDLRAAARVAVGADWKAHDIVITLEGPELRDGPS